MSIETDLNPHPFGSDVSSGPVVGLDAIVIDGICLTAWASCASDVRCAVTQASEGVAVPFAAGAIRLGEKSHQAATKMNGTVTFLKLFRNPSTTFGDSGGTCLWLICAAAGRLWICGLQRAVDEESHHDGVGWHHRLRQTAWTLIGSLGGARVQYAYAIYNGGCDVCGVVALTAMNQCYYFSVSTMPSSIAARRIGDMSHLGVSFANAMLPLTLEPRQRHDAAANGDSFLCLSGTYAGKVHGWVVRLRHSLHEGPVANSECFSFEAHQPGCVILTMDATMSPAPDSETAGALIVATGSDDRSCCVFKADVFVARLLSRLPPPYPQSDAANVSDLTVVQRISGPTVASSRIRSVSLVRSFATPADEALLVGCGGEDGQVHAFRLGGLGNCSIPVLTIPLYAAHGCARCVLLDGFESHAIIMISSGFDGSVHMNAIQLDTRRMDGASEASCAASGSTPSRYFDLDGIHRSHPAVNLSSKRLQIRCVHVAACDGTVFCVSELGKLFVVRFTDGGWSSSPSTLHLTCATPANATPVKICRIHCVGVTAKRCHYLLLCDDAGHIFAAGVPWVDSATNTPCLAALVGKLPTKVCHLAQVCEDNSLHPAMKAQQSAFWVVDTKGCWMLLSASLCGAGGMQLMAESAHSQQQHQQYFGISATAVAALGRVCPSSIEGAALGDGFELVLAAALAKSGKLVVQKVVLKQRLESIEGETVTTSLYAVVHTAVLVNEADTIVVSSAAAESGGPQRKKSRRLESDPTLMTTFVEHLTLRCVSQVGLCVRGYTSDGHFFRRILEKPTADSSWTSSQTHLQKWPWDMSKLLLLSSDNENDSRDEHVMVSQFGGAVSVRRDTMWSLADSASPDCSRQNTGQWALAATWQGVRAPRLLHAAFIQHPLGAMKSTAAIVAESPHGHDLRLRVICMPHRCLPLGAAVSVPCLPDGCGWAHVLQPPLIDSKDYNAICGFTGRVCRGSPTDARETLLLAVGGERGTIRVIRWNLDTSDDGSSATCNLAGAHDSNVLGLCFVRLDKDLTQPPWLVSCGSQGTLTLWTPTPESNPDGYLVAARFVTSTHAEVETEEAVPRFLAVAQCEAAPVLAVGSSSGELAVFQIDSLATCTLRQAISCSLRQPRPILCVACLPSVASTLPSGQPDSFLVVCGDSHGRLWIAALDQTPNGVLSAEIVASTSDTAPKPAEAVVLASAAVCCVAVTRYSSSQQCAQATGVEFMICCGMDNGDVMIVHATEAVAIDASGAFQKRSIHLQIGEVRRVSTTPVRHVAFLEAVGDHSFVIVAVTDGFTARWTVGDHGGATHHFIPHVRSTAAAVVLPMHDDGVLLAVAGQGMNVLRLPLPPPLD